MDILTSEDMQNMPLESWMWFRMNFTSVSVEELLADSCPAEI